MGYNSVFKRNLPYFLIVPALLYYAMFWLRPVMKAIVEAFTDEFGGLTLDNFVRVFTEPVFTESLINTLWFAVLSIVIQFTLSFMLAMFLNQKFKGVKLLLFVALIPMAVPPTAVAIVWKTGFATNGWINSLLMTWGMIEQPIQWLTVNGFEALVFLVLIDTWTCLPGMMIIILAGLQNLNKEYEEAGHIFGANKWQVIKDITIPILKPTIITSVILRLIAAMQVWMIAVMMFGYGRVPFLVERIAYYTEMVPGVDGSEKAALSYSIIVSLAVLATAVLYLKASNKKMQESAK